MDDLLAQFLIEGPELIQSGSDALLALERQPQDRELLDSAFRATHTLKGSVGLFDLPAMGRALHAAEDVLSELRAERRPVESGVISALLAVLTQSDRWLEALENNGALPAGAEAAAASLVAALGAGATDSSTSGGSDDAAWAQALAAGVSDTEGPLVAIRYRPLPGSYFAGDDPIALARATPGLLRLVVGLSDVPPLAHYDPFVCLLTIDILAKASLEAVKTAFRFVPDQVEIRRAPRRVAVSESEHAQSEAAAVRALRIDPRRVDALAATAADLVAAKTSVSALAAMAAAGGDPRALAETLATRAAGLERLVNRLHDDVMALRMAPLAPLLRRYPRMVRELAASLGKEVELLVEDNGLEADKAVVEGLSEPLTHLMRNALDHGVETPEDRRADGKPARARIRLIARRDGANLLLDLSDDGRGIDPTAIRRKVMERGLMPAERLDALTDQEVVNLIFLPGFSTADRVTEVSGRGVGMDAVKAAVARLGGRVRLTSQLGGGTCVTLDLPLSVVLTKIMIVEASGERFGAPMDRVLETLKLTPDRVFAIRAGHAFDWRGRTAPLLQLSALVGRAPAPASGDLRVLVVQCADHVVGVVVDAIVDRSDVVLRPLTGLLSAMPGVLGSTVLGDGQVLMVLDMEELVG